MRFCVFYFLPIPDLPTLDFFEYHLQCFPHIDFTWAGRWVLLVLCAQELSTLPQTISSVSHTLIYLWRAATISTARCHQLPRLTHTSATLALYLVTFRPFWRLFSLNGYILTNLATFFFFLNLAIVQLEDFSSTVPRALALTPGAVSPLSASLLCSERQRSSAFSWP